MVLTQVDIKMGNIVDMLDSLDADLLDDFMSLKNDYRDLERKLRTQLAINAVNEVKLSAAEIRIDELEEENEYLVEMYEEALQMIEDAEPAPDADELCGLFNRHIDDVVKYLQDQKYVILED
jgi:hypothetical protein